MREETDGAENGRGADVEDCQIEDTHHQGVLAFSALLILVGCAILVLALFFYWKDRRDSERNVNLLRRKAITIYAPSITASTFRNSRQVDEILLRGIAREILQREHC